MINIKTPEQIRIMQEGGSIASIALREVLKEVSVGVKTIELDKVVETVILDHGAEPSFKTVDNYNHSTCINVNAGIVHGIPNNYEIRSGDVVSIDLGVLLKGFHTDLSYSVEVDTQNEQEFLRAGKAALKKAVSNCVVGKRLGDVSFAIQQEVESHGYSVSDELVGHGIGRELHEDPYVPCYGEPGTGLKLKEGMVFAIEVIYQKGKPELKLAADDWTLSTADSSLSGLFEKTIAVTKNGPVVITDFD